MCAVYNLVFREDVLATEGKISEYQRLEQASIARNRALQVSSVHCCLPYRSLAKY
jgi:hypothetical protein